jgi:hypothetical protein
MGVAAAICCDGNGTYLGASADLLLFGISSLQEALDLAEDLALTKNLVASDRETVVTEIKEGSKGRYGAIILDTNASSEYFQM